VRHSFPLGRVPKKMAERFANNIDNLLHERRCNLALSREVTNWLSGLDDAIYAMLADRGIVEPRQTTGTLNIFIDSYIEGRTDVTPRRLEKLGQAKRRLIEFFGDVELRTITAGDADEYSRWLLKQVAATTAQKECQIASQFFRFAFRKEMIDRNPFDGVSTGTSTNDDRRVFVERDVVGKVIDTCPDWQWQTVVALARYGGLRCSSEVALLKWTDICWDQDRFTVTSPKTKRYGKASRLVPLFPELKPFLDEAFEKAEDGAVWVVPMLAGQPDKNLGTTFKKIIARVGVEEWPKPFQNLRASRQTELERQHPTYKVCAWMGNTPNIAHKHYLTVTDDDFTSAAQSPAGNSRGTQTPETGCNEAQKKTSDLTEIPENAGFAEIVAILENDRVAGTGFEPATSRL
jgi:integrase